MAEFTVEPAQIDMICDKCQGVINAGETTYVDMEAGKVLCENCGK
jgi:RNase P subunit RPR2